MAKLNTKAPSKQEQRKTQTNMPRTQLKWKQSPMTSKFCARRRVESGREHARDLCTNFRNTTLSGKRANYVLRLHCTIKSLCSEISHLATLPIRAKNHHRHRHHGFPYRSSRNPAPPKKRRKEKQILHDSTWLVYLRRRSYSCTSLLCRWKLVKQMQIRKKVCSQRGRELVPSAFPPHAAIRIS